MMQFWMKLCMIFICVLVCVTGADQDDKSNKYVSKLLDDLAERNRAFIEGGKTLLAMNEKAIIDAFNQVTEEDERRRGYISSRVDKDERYTSLFGENDNKDDKRGFFYSFASVVHTLPKLKEYFAPKKTQKELIEKINKEADMDALRTVRAMRMGREAREAGIRKVLASREKYSQPMESRFALRDDVFGIGSNESVCNLGRRENTPRLINSCSTRRECRVWRFNTTGDETLDSPSINFVNNSHVNITHMMCDDLPVVFYEDFNVTHCQITAIGCNDSTPLRDCPVEIICDDPSIVAFGIDDGRYAFKGTTDTIYCNGIPVDDPTKFTNGTLPEECVVKRAPSATNGTCTYIDASGNVTVLRLPCSLSCFTIVADAHCECPLDYTGIHCETPQNITCTAYLMSPLPKCVKSGDDNLLVYDRPCMQYYSLGDADIEMKWNVSCKFSSPSLRNQTGEDNFTYWLSTPDLKLSTSPSWTVKLEAFQFSSFISPISLYDSVNMTYDNIIGKEGMTFVIHPDAQHIVGGRVYAELGFDANHTPPGYKLGLLRRFFLDDTEGGYNGGNGEDIVLREGLGSGEIAIIIIASVVAFAIIAGIIRFLYDRWKEEKTADEEVNGNDVNKPKRD